MTSRSSAARSTPPSAPSRTGWKSTRSVGYLGIISLAGQAGIDGIQQGLTELLRGDPLDGLIIDLRASDTGAPAVTISTLGNFVEGEVGEYHSRVGNEPIQIEPSDLFDQYAEVPVAVLVDEQTEADAEQLAAILQDQGRAVIVGAQTSGQTHGVATIDFPEGSLLQVVSFGFQLPDGRTLEGEGVTPDVPVEADWLAYPESEDPFILAALDALSAPAASPAPEGGSAPSLAPDATAPAATEACDRRGIAGRIEVAGHLVARLDLDERRDHALADAGDDRRAAGREGAAGWQVARIGRLAADDRALPMAIGRIGLRHRRQQGLGVGVQWAFDDRSCRCQLHHAAGVHHRDAVGEVTRRGQVVRDVQERQAARSLQLGEQIEDLRATRRVDHRDGLVRDQVVGLQHHGAGDAHAL